MTLRVFVPGLATLLAAAVALSMPVRAQTSDPATQPQKPIEDVTVLGVQDKIIRDFVTSTVAPTNTLIGQLARWEKGICPVTTGLSPGFNAFVTARVKEVAAQIGAKVETNSHCKTNVQIIFTPHPQGLLNGIRRKAPGLLGSHYKAEEKDLATARYPIQAWYATATADNRGTLTVDDIGDISQQCEFRVGKSVINASTCNIVRGSRINEGWRSEFANVAVVVDLNKIADTEIGPVADDVAMLALAQIKPSEACRAVPSISSLFAPDCDADRRVKALTEYDLAYLRGLYQMDTGLKAGLAQINLADWMKRSLDGNR